MIAQRATGSRLKTLVIPAKVGIQLLCAGLLFSFALSGCADSNKAPADLNMVVSVSSDGNYAIATNTNKQAVLWNLKDHSYKIVFKDANIYSAYFIKNTNDFMYQNDKTNEVVVENTDGKVIKTFNPGFPTYGEVMTSNLNTWFASDVNYEIYKMTIPQTKPEKMFAFFCPPDHPNEIAPKGAMSGCASVQGDGKLFNLTLTPDDTKLIGAGFGGAIIWSAQTGKILHVISGNDAQTVAAINPEGSYLVTADIMQRAVNYNLNTGKQRGFIYKFPSRPEAAVYYANGGYPHEVLAAKFIDNNRLLVILNGLNNPFNYAALFNPKQLTRTTNPYQVAPYLYDLQPIKYLPLIKNAATDTTNQKDWPLTTDQFSRDQAIDTSPSAHILVMSMAGKNGIIVYRYDPKTQTLKREWAGVVKPSWKFW